MSLLNIGGPGAGTFPENEEWTVRFTEAVTRYDCVQFDFNNVATGLTATPGGKPGTSIFNTVRQPDAQANGARTLLAFWFGIAQQTAAAGTDGTVIVRGLTPANVPAACVAGSTMSPQVGSQLLITTTGLLSKIVAIGLDADVSNIAPVVFDGINGFGSDFAS